MTTETKRVSLCGNPYKISTYFLGTKKEGDYQEKEFYYVPVLGKIFSRNRCYFPYGNNAGDYLWREFPAPGDPGIYNHPAQTEALLPAGTKILAEPHEVLLEVSRKFGKAWEVTE